MDDTALDRAHRAMMLAAQEDAPRLAWYHCFADTELFLLLTHEPTGETLSPALFELSEGRFALVFDLEERLSAFADGPVPYAALPGRVIAAALAGQGIGICVNLEVVDSTFVMPPEAVDWLTEALDQRPAEDHTRLAGWIAPENPELARALIAKFAGYPVPTAAIWLAGLRHGPDQASTAVVFVDVKDGFEEPLAKAANEAVLFSGQDPEGIAILFLTAEQAQGIEAAGQPLWNPPEEPLPEPKAAPQAPGSDPARPPRLR